MLPNTPNPKSHCHWTPLFLPLTKQVVIYLPVAGSSLRGRFLLPRDGQPRSRIAKRLLSDLGRRRSFLSIDCCSCLIYSFFAASLLKLLLLCAPTRFPSNDNCGTARVRHSLHSQSGQNDLSRRNLCWPRASSLLSRLFDLPVCRIRPRPISPIKLPKLSRFCDADGKRHAAQGRSPPAPVASG